MPKATKSGYYAVRAGRAPGIYTSWVDCEAQIKGFPNAAYKKLSTEAEAIEFMAAARPSTPRRSMPLPSTSRLVEPSNARTRAVEVAQDERDCDIVYCDGACKGNGQPGSIAGIGVWWGHGDPRNISERCPGDQTNNRAELIAIVRILETTPHLTRRLLIKTDSNYSIQCVTTWIFNWMKNGFVTADGKPVKNRTLIKYLAALLHVRRKTRQVVEFKHVRGHVGIEGNEAADELANLGATKSALPERDWEKLEKQVLQSLKSAKPARAVDDDLKAYAAGLLNEGELAELSNTSVDTIASPAQEQKQRHSTSGKYVNQSRTSISPVRHDASPLRMKDAGLVALKSGRANTTVRSTDKLPQGKSSRPAVQLLPLKIPTATISKKELEAYASCLLDDDELSALGDTGVFDSDF